MKNQIINKEQENNDLVQKDNKELIKEENKEQMNDSPDHQNKEVQNKKAEMKLVNANNVSANFGLNSFLDIDIVNDREKALELFSVLVKSKQLTGKSPEEAMVLYIKSKELGLPFMTASDHMHIINGKAGVDVHILKAKLLKAGNNIWWEKTEDYVPLYKYVDGTGFQLICSEAELNDLLPREYQYTYDEVSVKAAKDAKKVPVYKSNNFKPVDWRTTYIFYRIKKIELTDELKTLTEVSSFSWDEAITAGLPLDKSGALNKDSNWVKRPKLMCDHRAFTNGARSIGADILFGLYDSKELLDENKKSYLINSEGDIINYEDV